jgi:hypothetical protein
MCVKSKGKAFSCAPCAKAKQKCEGVAWFGSVAGPSRKSEGGPSGSVEIASALTDIVSVLRQIKNELESVRGAIEDRFNEVEVESEADSEEGLEVDQEELAELEAEGTIFGGFRTWVVETGQYKWVRKIPLPGIEEEEPAAVQEAPKEGEQSEAGSARGPI